MMLADLELALSSCFDAMVLVERDTRRVAWANGAAVSLWSLASGPLSGLPIEQLLRSPEDALFWQSPDDSPEGLWSETTVDAGGGRLRAIERRVKPLSIHGFDGWLVCARDLSDVRAAEQELEGLIADLRSTLDSTADGLLVLDTHWHIRQFNRRFAELWAIPAAFLTERDDARIWQWLKAQVY